MNKKDLTLALVY